ncbi:hypothetical protein AAFN46_13230 [Pseudomonas sp. CAU 1711]|uniref:hypothetical protein n=1 Tax=Pseudomonas sp. CAU 1711 TaxID=3140356 RepID=UPI003260441A
MVRNIHIKWMVAVLGIAAAVNIFTKTIIVPELGDGKLMALILANREIFPATKYLAGMETLRMGYAAIWQFPPLLILLPDTIINHSDFIRIAGIVVMACMSIYLLQAYPGKYRVLLVITTPIWILFSFGYLEYYPFIAGVYLALLCWAFDGDFEEKSELSIGLIAGSLPLLYLGFAPVSFIMLLVYLWGARTAVVARTLAALFLGFVITLKIFWANNLSDYFISLYQEMNFGEKNTVYEAYRGMSANATSIFFKSSYVWSVAHLKEISGMLAYGLGLAPIAIFAIGIFVHIRKVVFFTKKSILAILILGWALFYLIYTIPKLGPIVDIDMFFMTYITVAFFGGALLDMSKNIKHTAIGTLCLLSTCASLMLLLRLTAI